MSTTMDEKRQFPRPLALEVAKELVAPLKSVSARLIVAGSLRRGKASVGDVEIVLVPKMETRKVDMFDSAEFSLADPVFEEWLAKGLLEKRPSKTGVTTWGEKNRLATHVRTGMPVDFFVGTPSNWWNLLVCRTGPGRLNVEIARRAQDRGWKWHPYGEGFEHLESGKVRAMGSEEEVLQFVGLEPRSPEERERDFSRR